MNENDLPTIGVESLIAAMRERRGIDVTVADIVQFFLESDGTYSVDDGLTIRVYEKGTDDLLMVMAVPK